MTDITENKKTEEKGEVLDLLSKVLLATHNITFMYRTIYGVHATMLQIHDKLNDHGDTWHIEANELRSKVLTDSLEELVQIMENLGNYMNNTDCISPIDVRITDIGFKILVHGEDEVEELYDESNKLTE